MAREAWKCPYDDCDAQSGRYWNLKRHIERLHDDIGLPVKSKRSVIEQSLPKLSSEDTNHPALDGGHRAHEIHREEDDSINYIYKIFKKGKSKYDKVKEMKDFFSELYIPTFSLVPHMPHTTSWISDLYLRSLSIRSNRSYSVIGFQKARVSGFQSPTHM